MPKKDDILTHAVGGRLTAVFLNGPLNLSEESQEVWRQYFGRKPGSVEAANDKV